MESPSTSLNERCSNSASKICAAATGLTIASSWSVRARICSPRWSERVEWWNHVSYVAFRPSTTAPGSQSIQVKIDTPKKRLVYAVLMHCRDWRSLVLLVLVYSLNFVRTATQNEFVRLLDTLWVPLRFVHESKVNYIRLLRHAEAAIPVRAAGVGPSLGSAVWRNYITTFTYPIRTLAER